MRDVFFWALFPVTCKYFLTPAVLFYFSIGIKTDVWLVQIFFGSLGYNTLLIGRKRDVWLVQIFFGSLGYITLL
jgi:hypothetical protein